jgi:hypothetical protein
MADSKAIMTMAVAGHSYDEIAAAVGCSRRDVVRRPRVSCKRSLPDTAQQPWRRIFHY